MCLLLKISIEVPPTTQNLRKGSAFLALVLVLAVVSAFLGLSAAKISQVALSSTSSNGIAIEVLNLASSEAELLRATSYSSLACSYSRFWYAV